MILYKVIINNLTNNINKIIITIKIIKLIITINIEKSVIVLSIDIILDDKLLSFEQVFGRQLEYELKISFIFDSLELLRPLFSSSSIDCF